MPIMLMILQVNVICNVEAPLISSSDNSNTELEFQDSN